MALRQTWWPGIYRVEYCLGGNYMRRNYLDCNNPGWIFWIGIFQVGVIQDGIFPGGNVPGGSYPGWEFSGWELSGWELSWVGIVRVGVILGGNFFSGGFPGWSFLGGSFPSTFFWENVYFFCGKWNIQLEIFATFFIINIRKTLKVRCPAESSSLT